MFKETFKKRVLFVGIPDMAYVCLDGLHHSGINIVGVVGPKKEHNTYQHFKRFVQGFKLNFIEYENLDDPDFIEKIRGLKADIAIVCSFNYKIPDIILNSVKDGFVNVHPSLLPKYRGSNPYSTVIINNETETGVTLHLMDSKFDTGDIVAQRSIAIMPMETMGTIFNRLNVLAFNMLLEFLRQYEKADFSRQKQPEGEFPKGKLTGSEFIDWNKSALEIGRFIRALNPFIVATTDFRKNIIKIFSANVIDEDCKDAPGTIVKIDGDKFYISTCKGLIEPTALQFGSFFIGPSSDFIKILNISVGEKFGAK